MQSAVNEAHAIVKYQLAGQEENVKRLKTAFSAVLALSMALGMVVVPAGAADGTYQNAVYPERICRKAQPTTSIRINRNGTPVSYTHLDVYKRQLLHGAVILLTTTLRSTVITELDS